MNVQLIITALLVLKSSSSPQPPEPSPTAADPHLTTLDANPPIDIGRDGTGFVAIPERGLLLERTGTLISHTSYDVATVIIQLQKLNFTQIYRHSPPNCDNNLKAQLQQVEQHYINELTNLENALYEAILLSEIQLKSARLCDVFQLNGPRCTQMPTRQKRFFITGAAALATAGTALDLSLQNERQIK